MLSIVPFAESIACRAVPTASFAPTTTSLIPLEASAKLSLAVLMLANEPRTFSRFSSLRKLSWSLAMASFMASRFSASFSIAISPFFASSSKPPTLIPWIVSPSA